MKKDNKKESNQKEKVLEKDKVSTVEGLKEVGKIFTDDPSQYVETDDDVLEKMVKDLEKRISKCTDSLEKEELEKELLILQILILQREKIDKEAAYILYDGDAFGLDLENDKEKKKRKKEKEKKQQELINKLQQYGISDLNIDIKPVKKENILEKGGYERQERTR